MKKWCLLLLLLGACKQERKISPSFYYWKTVYKNNAVEQDCLQHFHASKLYIRITDVDQDELMRPVPVSPVVFEDKLPSAVQIVPVIFIVNQILENRNLGELRALAQRMATFTAAKVRQAGKNEHRELQVDCDWTVRTRDNYFHLLSFLQQQPELKNKLISVTLRLHQLRNLQSCGIPPVKRAMLMCYNMGNLRKYGSQNSILDLNELKKYVGDNLKQYPLKLDIGLPLFSWAVAFRNKAYLGISRNLSLDSLQDHRKFRSSNSHLFQAIIDLPDAGLLQGDVVRWESPAPDELRELSAYLSSKINNDTLNIIYFHLDQKLLSHNSYAQLQKINDIWR